MADEVFCELFPKTETPVAKARRECGGISSQVRRKDWLNVAKGLETPGFQKVERDVFVILILADPNFQRGGILVLVRGQPKGFHEGVE